ncbi:hypothetical protein SOVF_157320 [Spinacia oleracea]|uniref:Glycosyltransferase n=1 Tax=Spinacia oleracea TaxID=3562 RepID=A0A9R0IQG5_SPIOL|nr:scopoletin glucosyltransferase-like [Spinacia oleracea]KNA09036.1 hypothetical protein SOVF_157320 [Spinacia oleracea]
MSAEPKRLHVVFFPLMAAGHMIPIIDIAKLFASHHVKTTIVTTPLNAPTLTKALNTTTTTTTTTTINVEVIPFPHSNEADGIPQGIENFHKFNSNAMAFNFLKATTLLQQSLEQILEKHKPDCLVADVLLTFATDVAAKFNIPRLVFLPANCFSQCVTHSLIKYQPFKTVSSDNEEFLIPHLPHEVKLMKSQLPKMMRGDLDMDIVNTKWMEIFVQAMETESKSYGVIFNSFYELEPQYADYYRNVIGRKAWSIGPVSLCNRENEAKFQRGEDSCIDEHECLNWLNSKNPNSVVYICFGSLAQVSNSQLEEIAMGLEASEQDFIWVLSSSEKDDKIEEFEKRVQGKGLIIRGWAPQVLILDHQAIGAFVTHCGWNSTLEGLSCGVPMVTWPVFAEHFYIEKLVTQVLETGVGVGAKEWNRMVEGIKWEHIRDAIRKVMVGEEALELRSKAKKMKDLARKAVEVGGSSYCDLSSLIQELSSYNNATTYVRD